MEKYIQNLQFLLQPLLLIISLFPLVGATHWVEQQFEPQATEYQNENHKISDFTPAFSCSTDTVRNQFDFWIGRWDVFVDGEKVAESHIESTLSGCMIMEHYQNLKNGYAGKSMNFYDAKQKQWIQIWTDSEGSVSRYQGKMREAKMYFSGINTLRDGRQTRVRMEFIPADDGSVRQIYEQSTGDEANWETLFDGIYRPRKG